MKQKNVEEKAEYFQKYNRWKSQLTCHHVLEKLYILIVDSCVGGKDELKDIWKLE